MEVSSNLAIWLIVWTAAASIIVFQLWNRRLQGSGLILAYLLNFALIHWFGAVIYLFPWYDNRDPGIVEAGFFEATCAIVAFAIGVLAVAPSMMRMFEFPPVASPREPVPRLAKIYMTVGFAAYFILVPLLGHVPTLSAVLSGLWNLIVVGLALACWIAWQARDYKAFGWWFAGALGLPFLTTVTQGFLGYGTTSFLIIFGFVSGFVRPRSKLAVLSGILLYLGLSFYVSYMRDRQELRDVIWTGAPVVTRVSEVYRTVSDIEWFDPYNIVHLGRIDDRLNQNHLVGATVYYLDSGYQDFASGTTLWQAIIALVPRAIWPDKPVVAGSMGLVTEYTGIPFAEGTSVGLGQVIEFYINFGTLGVLLGFLVLGIIIAIVDKAAAERLHAGDWQGFALWFLPGIALLQVGGSLVEVSASFAASLIAVFIVNKVLLRRYGGKKSSMLLSPFKKAQPYHAGDV